MNALAHVLLYGVVLTGALGLLASWVDRKVTARVQYRVGPPVLQPWYDLVKLFGKETLLPRGGAHGLFLLSPLIGFAGAMLASAVVWMAAVGPGQAFIGDLIVVVYLFLLPSLSVVLGACASGNPLASVGAAREIKLILAYELPFVLAVFVPVVHAGFRIDLGAIVSFQHVEGPVIFRWSGLIAFVVALFCVQAKLAFVPFDMAEGETEIGGGVLIEYSGAGLALYRLTKSMLLAALPLLMMVLFLGGVRTGGLGAFSAVLKYAALLAVITVMRNTNPRVRIDQAIRFFWGPLTVAALAGVWLAIEGW